MKASGVLETFSKSLPDSLPNRPGGGPRVRPSDLGSPLKTTATAINLGLLTPSVTCLVSDTL